MTKLIWWSLLLLAAAVFAKDADILLRIRQTQDLLSSRGPNLVVLGEYDRLISDLEIASEDKEENIARNVVAQVYYKKALVELSLNKVQLAIGDLARTLDLDPTLTPASSKLMEVLMDAGKFADIRARFSSAEYPDTFLQMEKWESAYLRVSSYLAGENSDMTNDQCLETILLYLMPITPSNPGVCEAHLQCTKGKIREALAANDDDTVQALFKEVISDYSSLLKLQPQRNLQHYSDFAEFALFTQLMVQESWNIAKACLRIDNVFGACGSLSKTFSKLQEILKMLEEYSILNGYLYPNVGEQTDLPQERLDSFDFDFNRIDAILSAPVNLAKRELNKLPPSVKTTYDFLTWKADVFSQRELGQGAKNSHLKFIIDLNRLACEAGVRSGNAKSKHCSEVNDDNDMFFPKHSAQVDQLLKKKKFDDAQKLMQKINKNVQKTALFKERWAVIERHKQQQQQKQQQHEFRQRQQRQHQYQRQRQQQQHQQQQRQQPQHDTSKDYYKILDIPRDADDKTIKKGYRAQTLKYHPDKYKGGDLTEREIEGKMQEVNEAYEVLSDAQSRESYDRGDSQQGGSGNQGHPGHGGGFGGQPNMKFHFDNDFMGNFMRDGHFQFHF